MNDTSLAGARHRLAKNLVVQTRTHTKNKQPKESRPQVDKVWENERAISLCDGLISLLSETMEIPSELFRATSRSSASVARARQTGMYLAHVSLGLSMAQVASGFARNKSTVVHACHTIEDLRDDEDFDRFVARQERIIQIILEGRWDVQAVG
ncbi:MAG: helix-turn-helix domain-containing protein [Pseudomonadota bacterium]